MRDMKDPLNFEDSRSDDKHEDGKDVFVADLEWLMRSVRGRRLAHWVLAEAGVFHTTFVEVEQRAPYMALAMAHEEGRKKFGYKFFAKLMAICPELYAKMIKEGRDGRHY